VLAFGTMAFFSFKVRSLELSSDAGASLAVPLIAFKVVLLRAFYMMALEQFVAR
jgi:hypothetical protein